MCVHRPHHDVQQVALPSLSAVALKCSFQFIAVFNQRFPDLPRGWQTVHFVALLLATLTVCCMLTVAAFHRIAEPHKFTTQFVSRGGWTVSAGLLFLATAICLDIGVVTQLIYGSTAGAIAAAASTWTIFILAWFAYPIGHRIHYYGLANLHHNFGASGSGSSRSSGYGSGGGGGDGLQEVRTSSAGWRGPLAEPGHCTRQGSPDDTERDDEDEEDDEGNAGVDRRALPSVQQVAAPLMYPRIADATSEGRPSPGPGPVSAWGRLNAQQLDAPPRLGAPQSPIRLTTQRDGVSAANETTRSSERDGAIIMMTVSDTTGGAVGREEGPAHEKAAHADAAAVAVALIRGPPSDGTVAGSVTGGTREFPAAGEGSRGVERGPGFADAAQSTIMMMPLSLQLETKAVPAASAVSASSHPKAETYSAPAGASAAREGDSRG